MTLENRSSNESCTPKKILFLENRGKTHFWSEIATDLESKSFEVHFLVQNSLFSPKKRAKNVHVLPLPDKNAIADSEGAVPSVLKSYLRARDRGFRYFNSGDDHYGYYYKKIKTALDSISPDLVVGECTLFHELIMIYLCDRLNIKFIHPAECRYPPDRFQLLLADSQDVAIGSNETWDNTRIDEFIGGIKSGQVKPAYMIKLNSHYSLLKFNFSRISMLMRVFYARLLGERYNTPSIFRKFVLTNKLKKSLSEWDKRAVLPSGKNNVLYLMQMQPEANLEVWGADFSDQVATIKHAANLLPDDSGLIIKINPSAKYEIIEIFRGLQDVSNIFFAPRELNVDSLLSKVIGILTVTGTVGLESVFKRINCISLRHPVIAKICPDSAAESIEEAITKLFMDEDLSNTKGRESRLLADLVAGSFPGSIGDPIYSPSSFVKENISKVSRAIEQILI